ncbi:MAG: helix-turn-helix transcriptional regulator [Cyclobacteriaceae bacterium]|nr:helix-turn-helix transcriptional regulator [Cyclobacteriaceae bacterium SS2]
MLKLNLAYLFKVRGVKSAFGFLRKIGFTHYVAYSWSSERRKSLHIEHITKLCIALNCTPNDLLCWEDGKYPLAAGHPLQKLRSQHDKPFNIDLMKSFPLDKVDRLQKFLEEEMGTGSQDD